MIGLRVAKATDQRALAALIYSSAPTLLDFMFGEQAEAIQYIEQACAYPDGQYSAARHMVAVANRQFLNEQKIPDDEAIASITLWSGQLPDAFQLYTAKSLVDCLTKQQLRHIEQVNQILLDVFLAPTTKELCIGHLAVAENFRGLGIGKKLIAYALREAKLQKKHRLILDVDSNNVEAVSFYQACNFNPIKETEFSPTQQSFLRMHYQL